MREAYRRVRKDAAAGVDGGARRSCIREEAGLPGLRIHDARHTWASQGIVNGVGLSTVGPLLGHRKRRTTAIYAHLDDAALQDAAARAAAVIAGAMGYKAESPPLSEQAEATTGDGETNPHEGPQTPTESPVSSEFPWSRATEKWTDPEDSSESSRDGAYSRVLAVVGRSPAKPADEKHTPRGPVNI